MIQNLSGVAGTTSATTPSLNKSLGKEDFLKLLVAQLAAQDPLEPMDAQDFSAQLAQFSALEQMTNVNKNLETIRELESFRSNSSAVSLIGKNIDAPGHIFAHNQGENEILSFSLKGDAASVQVDVFDNSGKKVRTLNLGSQPAGPSQIIWDGSDNTGQKIPAGNFSFQVTAENAAGNFVETQTYTSGLVTDVVLKDDKAFAVVNGAQISTDEITRISLN